MSRGCRCGVQRVGFLGPGLLTHLGPNVLHCLDHRIFEDRNHVWFDRLSCWLNGVGRTWWRCQAKWDKPERCGKRCGGRNCSPQIRYEDLSECGEPAPIEAETWCRASNPRFENLYEIYGKVASRLYKKIT